MLSADVAEAAASSGMDPRLLDDRRRHAPGSFVGTPSHPSATNTSQASKNSLNPARLSGLRLSKSRNKLTQGLETRTSGGNRTAFR